jgi:hypothetical protein
MESDIINKVKRVLNDWNPLGENARNIDDLNEYETEAIDILFYIDLEITTKRPVEVKKQIQKYVKEILTESFNIDLTNEECRIPAKKIYQILYET